MIPNQDKIKIYLIYKFLLLTKNMFSMLGNMFGSRQVVTLPTEIEDDTFVIIEPEKKYQEKKYEEKKYEEKKYEDEINEENHSDIDQTISLTREDFEEIIEKEIIENGWDVEDIVEETITDIPELYSYYMNKEKPYTFVTHETITDIPELYEYCKASNDYQMYRYSNDNLYVSL
jgi:hypothetical protein